MNDTTSKARITITLNVLERSVMEGIKRTHRCNDEQAMHVLLLDYISQSVNKGLGQRLGSPH